jgi:hypothetical protein
MVKPTVTKLTVNKSNMVKPSTHELIMAKKMNEIIMTKIKIVKYLWQNNYE